MKIFLGGTCNESTWRSELIPLLTIDYFDPVVDDWDDEAQKEELKQREECDYCLYCITPSMTGFYSIAEVIDDSNKRPNKTIFCHINEDDKSFTEHQHKSLKAVSDMVLRNGGVCFRTLQDIADYVNEI